MSFDREKLKARIEEHLYAYVGTRSDTGTHHERNIEKFYEKWFKEVPYFMENPEHCGIFKIPGDHLERHVPWALLKGEGDETIVLLHHSDTVDSKDYLTLGDIALKPEELERALREGKLSMPEDAKQDLESGEWLFGRGTNDMKGGAAIHIAMMEEYTKEKNFKGNLLLIAAPDEENLSAGAIGAAYLLNDLSEKYGLKYKLCLLAEPDTTEGTFHNGSAGKIMPLIYVRGKIAHVGRVYDGLSPVKILAKIMDSLDLNPGFIETDGQTTTPAPAFLYAKDHKEIYDVSLPTTASGFMSVFCLERTPKELIELTRGICEEAMGEAIKSVANSFAEFKRIGKFPEFLRIGNFGRDENPWKVNVKLYSELYEEALRDSGDEFIKEINKTKEELSLKVKASQITLTRASHEIIERTLGFVKDLSPVVIITLIPPYYPCVSNAKLPEEGKFIDGICDLLIAYAKEKNNHNYLKSLATYMCDFSYMMQTDSKEDNEYIENNMLMWGDGYYIPFEKIRKISMPLLNVGPLGRGIHQFTERVLKSDVFYTIPDYVDFTVRKVLGH